MAHRPFGPWERLDPEAAPEPDRPKGHAGSLEGTTAGEWSQIFRIGQRINKDPHEIRQMRLWEFSVLLGQHEPYEPEFEEAERRSRADSKRVQRRGGVDRTARGEPKAPPIKGRDLLKARVDAAAKGGPPPEARPSGPVGAKPHTLKR